jgi:hypothetical protein
LSRWNEAGILLGVIPDAEAQPSSSEPLALLLAITSNRVLLDVIKRDRRLASVIFLGFAARVQSLALPAVRARLERELPKYPEVLDALFSLWQKAATPLLNALNADTFSPTSEALAPLLADYGEEPLRYALLHAEREDVRAWADLLENVPVMDVTPATTAPASPQPAGQSPEMAAMTVRIRELQGSVREAEQGHDTARREIAARERQLVAAAEVEALLRKQVDALEAQVDRERRRAKRAEDEVDALRKQLREREPAPTSAKPADPTATIAEAVALLQQGLQSLQGSIPPTPSSAPAPKPKPAPARKPTPPEASVILPGVRGTHTYPLAAILGALQRNDVKTVEKVRDGIARLADQPAKEREALQRLAKVGIPTAVLAGPLRPAVVDGSNVANMSHQARGKLEYLEQIRRSAWAEGYFPVVVFVDASLRYQIDQPDQLMRMVEDGRITMTEPGTPADPVLIREALARDAVLITNDRMEDWPEAKSVTRRKASMAHGAVRIGSFHGTGSSWFGR